MLADCVKGAPERVYDGGRIAAEGFLPARWDLMPKALHVGVGADRPRLSQALLVLLRVAHRWAEAAAARRAIAVIEEIVQLRRLGFRFIALADDNFYPVTLDRYRAGREAERRAPACRVEAICAPSASSSWSGSRSCPRT